MQVMITQAQVLAIYCVIYTRIGNFCILGATVVYTEQLELRELVAVTDISTAIQKDLLKVRFTNDSNKVFLLPFSY